MPEAKLTRTEHGFVPEGDGWFVVNARDVPWTHTENLGSACFFEGEQRFQELGINVNVLNRGDAGGMYHAEATQEGFLVLAGEGVAIVEGEERPLRPWDYFHCPPDTPHIVVATSERPLIYIAVGSRVDGKSKGLVYPVDEAAIRHDAGVREETTSGKEAYAGQTFEQGPYRDGDLPDV